MASLDLIKDAANRNVTANGERYREMISNFFCPKCNALLTDEFAKHFISRSGPINWPLRFQILDLTPLDYFLWGYIKAHVYTDKPTSIGALEDNIESFIREIPAEILERVCQK